MEEKGMGTRKDKKWRWKALWPRCKVHKIDAFNAIKQWETILNLNALMERWDDLIDFVGLCCCSLFRFLQLMHFCAFFEYLWYNLLPSLFFSLLIVVVLGWNHTSSNMYISWTFSNIFFISLTNWTIFVLLDMQTKRAMNVIWVIEVKE
jgi:hypothetical protein